MKIKKSLMLPALLLTILMLLSACTGAAPQSQADAGQTNAGGSTEKIRVELMEHGWVDAPLPDGDADVYKKWVDETYNFDFVVNSSFAFEEQITVRFASGSPPDIVAFRNDLNLMRKLYDQGLLLEDFTPYLDKVPTIVKHNLTEEARLPLTVNGKLIALCNSPRSQAWALQIRKDWLEEIGKDMPKTTEELLEVCRLFKEKQLYESGVDNTISITSSDTPLGVTGWSFGYNFDAYTTMFGPEDWYITDDGKLSHAIVAGYKKDMLDFVKTCIDEGHADPDWATQEWSGKQAKFWRGQVGVIWYPFEAIINETVASDVAPKEPLDMWAQFDVPPKGGNAGGMYQNQIDEAFYYTVPKTLENDSDKLGRILEFIDSVTYPNENYWTLRYGVGIDEVQMKDLENGSKYVWMDAEAVGQTTHLNISVDNYGTWLATNDLVINGSTEEPDARALGIAEAMKKRTEAPAYPLLKNLFVLDAKDFDATNKVWSEFYVNYLLGKDTDYDAFVEQWLNAGGQNMIDSAGEQLKKMGVLK